jgi:hypothetical protein
VTSPTPRSPMCQLVANVTPLKMTREQYLALPHH